MTRRGRLLLAGVLVSLALTAQPVAAAEPSCEEVLIPLSDGTRLHGWIRHGTVDGPRPVLWTMTPYTNTGCRGASPIWTQQMVDAANVVTISYRGTGSSEGEQSAWGPGEADDVREVGDWLASKPWADGLVPTGESAEGAWITFALGHPAVKAAVWLTSCADGYRGCIRSGGQFAGGGIALTAGQVGGYMAGLQRRFEGGTDGNPSPAEQLAATVTNFAPALVEDEYGEYWDSRLGLDHLEQTHAPVMFTTDLYDFVPQGMYLAYEHTPPAYRWLNLGWGHAMPHGTRQEGSPGHAAIVGPIRDFIRRYVFDDGSAEPARVTTVTNNGTVSGYRRSELLVRPDSDWPLPDTRWTRLYLGDATLSDAPTADGEDLTPMATLSGPRGEFRTTHVAMGGAEPQNPEFFQQLVATAFDDLRPDEATGLTYTTAPLAQDSEMTGPIVLTIKAAATAPDFDWQVRLTDVHPDGRSSWISDGQLRASLRRVDESKSKRSPGGDLIRPWLPYDKHEQVPLSEPVEYVIELGPTSNVFRAGHRIRLDIQPVAEGYVDSARTAGVGVLRVLRGGEDGSRLLLPVIPSRCQDSERLPGVDPVECGAALAF